MQHQAIRRYSYHQWANDRLFSHLEKLPAEVYNQQIESVFPSVAEVVAHIYQVDGMWLSVMSGDTLEQTFKHIGIIKEQLSEKNLNHLKGLFSELSARYHAFFSGQKDLDRKIEIEHPKYGKYIVRISDLVEHVVNHGTYHRGNITAMLRQQGHAGVPTDFVFYVTEQNDK